MRHTRYSHDSRDKRHLRIILTKVDRLDRLLFSFFYCFLPNQSDLNQSRLVYLYTMHALCLMTSPKTVPFRSNAMPFEKYGEMK